MIEILTPNFMFQDDRGALIQLVRDGFKQINIIESKASCQRGGHYHKLNNEAFYIIQGRFDLIVNKNGEVKSYQFSKGDMFLIPAYVQHNFLFQEDTILVSMYDKGVELEDGEKDIYNINI